MFSTVSLITVAGLISHSIATSCNTTVDIVPQTMTFVLPTIFSVITETVTATTTATITTTSKYPFDDDTASFPSLLPLPDDIDVFEAYKKVAASQQNTTICHWYEGLSSVIPDGLPETPGLKSQTLQAWRVQQINSTRMRIDWSELIILADFQTGDDATFMFQPQSGLNNTAVPNYYYDGPVTYYVDKLVDNGINLTIVQPNSTILHTSIKGSLYNGQVQFYQTEEKIRSGSALTSTLQFIGSLADVRNPNITTAKASGYYHAAFSGTISSLFAYPNGTEGDTHILGRTQKQGAGNEGYYPKQWAELLVHFPEFFVNGTVSPNWTSILTDAGLSP